MPRKPLVLGLALSAVVILAAILGGAVRAAGGPASDTSQAGGARSAAPSAASQRALLTESLVLSASKDSWIDQENPTTNYGKASTLEVKRVGIGRLARVGATLVAFDIGALPSNAVVTNATLVLNPSGGRPLPLAPEAVFNVVPNGIQTAWTETGVTWSSTIQSQSYGDGMAPYNGSGPTVIDVTNIAKAWAAGTLVNNGILLYPDSNNPEGSVAWYSRNSTGRPPQLTITYFRRVTYTAQKDTWVDENLVSANYAFSPTLLVGKSAATGKISEILVDTAPLVSNMGIISANLRLYSQLNLNSLQPSAASASSVYVDAAMEFWYEDQVTWNSKPASSNRGDPPVTPNLNGYTSFDVTNIVSDWADGTLSKYGFLLRHDPASTGVYEFFAVPSSNRATLTVDFVLLPPPCVALTSATISGPTAGLTNTSYDFTVQTSPANADQPISYSWQATDHPGPISTASANYSWVLSGTKSVSVAASNCGGTVNASHQVIISAPPLSCPVPITGLVIEGPVIAALDSSTFFTATVQPVSATTPFTFTWSATDHGQIPSSGSATSDGRSFTWTTAGGKQVSVTAQQCGGTVNANHNVELIPPADLPDLDLSAIWYQSDQQRVAYMLHNQGLTAAPAGHTLALEQDSALLLQESYPQPLNPGAVRVGYLDQPWSCAGANALASVAADTQEIIAELSEANNGRAETWPCDLDPPFFTTGPTVYTRTETTAVIGWQTSEPTTSQLQYSRFSYVAPSIQNDSQLASDHQVTLSSLLPGSSYRLIIVAADQSGLQASSREVMFNTQPPGSDPPVINSFHLAKYPSPLYEFWGLRAELASSQYIDRVAFYMDGQLMGADYSPSPYSLTPASYEIYISPAALGLTPETFFDSHDFKAVAFTIAGISSQLEQNVTIPWEDRRVELTLDKPAVGDKVYVSGDSAKFGDRLHVSMLAYQLDWGCTWTGYAEGGVVPMGHQAVNCADVQREMDELVIRVDGTAKSNPHPPDDQLLIESTPSLGGLALGDHTVSIEAFASNPGPVEITRTFVIKRGMPDMTAEREVVRNGNLLDVTLVVRNDGQFPAWLDHVEDTVTGLVPVFQDDPGHRTRHSASYFFNTNQRREQLTFDLKAATGTRLRLNAGESYTMTYSAVPILYDRAFTAGIGDLPVKITYWDGAATLSASVSRPANLVRDPAFGLIPFSFGYAEAIGTADYLIVTNPWMISHHYGAEDGMDLLFDDMGKLASLRNGVIGYLSSTDKTVLDDLIEPGGAWADAMAPQFQVKDQGFLLIVGETEIVPSWYMGKSHFTTWISTESVSDTDLPYGNTAGSSKRSELVVGRIIGDTIWNLRVGLLTPIRILTGVPDYGFSRSRAMVVSGRGSNVTSNFIPTINTVGNVLDDEFDVSKIHFYDYNGGPLEHRAVFSATLPNQDLLLWHGHGNYTTWGSSDDTHSSINRNSIRQMPRGSTNPFLIAGACKNGNYEAGDDHNLAEAALEARFSGVIASTMNSVIQVNDLALKRFARKWDPGKAIGQTLNHVRWYVWDDDIIYDHGKLWAYEYNLYGDPKMGLDLAAGSMVQTFDPYAGPEPEQRAYASLVATGAMSLTVNLPDLVFEQIDGSTQVSLPGGGLMQDPGTYPLPTWQVTLPLPQGERVQEVQLAGRSDPLAYAGHSLALASADIACLGCLQVPATPQAMGEWHPALDQQFDWRVEELPDGGSELELRLFPVNYHIASQTLLFHRDITFTIKTLTTTLAIADLDVTQPAWEEGETVTFDLALRNEGGPAQEAIIRASVRYATSGDLVDGLPLRIITNLSGVSPLTLSWDSGSTEFGDYTLLVELLDTEGNLLDAAYQDFQLGILDGDLDQLAASAVPFLPGDLLDLSALISNTGTVPLTGTAVFLLSSAGPITYSQQLTLAVENLSPGATLPFVAQWDSASAPAGQDIRLLAYLKFNSTTTLARELWVNTWRYVYLPMAVKP